MLDSVTKKRIDSLRDILVGKIPDPKSQVEQITTGLIYKFMYDMDVETAEMGGVPSFFVGEYKKYSWENLFNPRLGGADKVKLYSDAIEKMYTNPTAPPMFREIFKNSFLPFKDPSTLNMFLKGINEFHYSHSEKLGDAFEYLLSFMGSQGDAGQFRTPRHIIDFIVKIVNPQKKERILDPACGTAGFLISSFKHIQAQNTGKQLGDRLTAAERKKLGKNLVGYDISPDMVRISLVNMYLHQFANPQIHEYDTLSSENRWNEYYDVILANPPFMTPKGGIQPHSRFGVKSTKAEVLFVDYIMEHLKPNGRAGILVPEGIIFQTGTAYKALRKKLVGDCLVGVISLPQGVFNPYSGVKTSILILDKELNQKSDSIFFAKVENDGFSLGAQRTPIKKNDLPQLLNQITNYLTSDEPEDLILISKDDILNKREVSLSISRYLDEPVTASNFPLVQLGDLISLEYGKPLKEKDRSGDGFPVFGSNGVVGFHSHYLVEGPCIIVGRKGSAGVVAFSSDNAFPIDTTFYVQLKNDEALLKYIYYSLEKLPLKTLNIQSGVPGLNRNDAYELKIPLPPIEVQQEIVDELEGYQKIIDGCRQVVENYKPSINIDPSWEIRPLKEILKVDWGNTTLTKSSYDKNGDYLGVSAAGVDGKINHFEYKGENIVISAIGANCGKVFYLSEKFTAIKNTMVLHLPDPSVNAKFYYYYFDAQMRFQRRGAGQPFLSKGDTESLLVPVPCKPIQDKIVKSLESEVSVVDGNKKLIDIYTRKIQDKISKVWGE